MASPSSFSVSVNNRVLGGPSQSVRRGGSVGVSAAGAASRSGSDEELGYIHTDDSFGKILADARHELSERFSEARRHPIGKTVSELIDELASKLTRGGRPGADD
jgi:hypothetical protein